MNFSALSIKHPIPAILLFILLGLAGIISFRGNGVQDFPDIELPVIVVTAELPGAAPDTLETEVARKLENSIATLSRIKHIYTTILDGNVSTSVEFELEKDVAEAENDVRGAVSRVRADLPAELRDPVVNRVATAGRPLMTYAVQSTQRDEADLSWFVDDTVTRRLLTIKGVGSVHRLGGQTREVQIVLDPLQMTAMRVSALDVSRQLRAVQIEAPGGRGDVSGAEQSVRTIATVATADQLANMDLPLPDGRHIRLGQIAQIQDSVAEQRAIALLNGQRVVGFEVSRSKGASEVSVSRAVRKAMDELRVATPDITLTEALDNVAPIEENFSGSMSLLYEGALLAVIVVGWFLRDWRSTLVAAVALPLSVIPTFLGMYWFGFTLNTVTLTSLGLVVGILVDDAIVEIENIARHLRMGKTPFQAALEAADEIGLAVVATTFALVAVFLPTAFMAGVPGKFFKQFGWTAVLAILASLVVARLVTPMMAAYLLKPVANETEADSPLMQRYLKAMKWCLHHRRITTVATIAFFIGSIMLVPLLPTGFVPPADRAQTMVNIELPPGSTLQETWQAAERARAVLQAMPDVKQVFSSIWVASVSRATLTVTLTHRSERHRKQQAVEAELREKLADQPGVRLTVGPADNGVKMQLMLKSDDGEALNLAAKAAERDLRTLKGVGNVSSSASLVRSEVRIEPDFARAADLGVTTSAISDTLRVATSGDYDQALAKLNLPQRQVPIRVKLPDSVRADLDALSHLLVPGKQGSVQLAQVANISMQSGAAQIGRLDRNRNVMLEVELGERQLGDVYAEAMQLPAFHNLPPGVKLAESGDTEMMAELFGSFGLAMSIGVLCIYMVLVLLFHDFMQPVTILAALPLSIGGAFILLLITRNSFSMPSLIGLLMLMGIVTKNSILLVEYAIVARRGGHGQTGMNRFDALVDACHKRARPIVMTSLAMGAGMLPVALGLGADPSFRAPMATAVIGGLITSTLLSLLVVPVVFTFVDDLKEWLRRRYDQATHLGQHHGVESSQLHPLKHLPQFNHKPSEGD